MPHVTRQVGQHRGDVVAGGHPSVDIGVGEVMPEIVGSWLLAGHGPRQPGLVPDAAEYLPDCCRADLVSGGRDEERVARGKMRSRGPVTRVEDLDDLISQRQPTAATAFGPDDVDVPGIEVDLTGLQGTGSAGPQPARVHQGEEPDRLPSPRARRLKLRQRRTTR